MRRYLKYIFAVAAATAVSGINLTAYGAEVPVGPGYEKEQPSAKSIDNLKVAEEADQIVLVIGEGEGSPRVTVSYHQKDESGLWNQVFTTPGWYGMNGGSADKTEGDGKTPLGLYRFTMAFGIKEDPGSLLPYRKIQAGDYWVDDSQSQHYNQYVNTKAVKKDWSSAENLSAMAPYYDYCLALNYNEERVPGKGSAIFLHCTRPGEEAGSHGCIKIPEELMVQVLKTAGENARIILVSEEEHLKQYYK